jgi:hypothetical protein
VDLRGENTAVKLIKSFVFIIHQWDGFSFIQNYECETSISLVYALLEKVEASNTDWSDGTNFDDILKRNI